MKKREGELDLVVSCGTVSGDLQCIQMGPVLAMAITLHTNQSIGGRPGSPTLLRVPFNQLGRCMQLIHRRGLMVTGIGGHQTAEHAPSQRQQATQPKLTSKAKVSGSRRRRSKTKAD